MCIVRYLYRYNTNRIILHCANCALWYLAPTQVLTESSPEGETRRKQGELSQNEGAHAHADETTLGGAEAKKNAPALLWRAVFQ